MPWCTRGGFSSMPRCSRCVQRPPSITLVSPCHLHWLIQECPCPRSTLVSSYTKQPNSPPSLALLDSAMLIHPGTRNFLRLLMKFLPKSAFPHFLQSVVRAGSPSAKCCSPWGRHGVGGPKDVEAARWFETSDSLAWIFLFCISLEK